jgi:predicted O-methyltransferase YrrM
MSLFNNKYRYNGAMFLQSELYRLLFNFINPKQKLSILEIGCYEGLSTTYFADNLLNHKDSILNCVDPYDFGDKTNHVYPEIEKQFYENIKICDNFHRINFHKKYSDDFFSSNHLMFDFIYIDGSHDPEIIIRDMENSFSCLRQNGIMWMDDYLGGPDTEKIIKQTMDKFIDKHKDQLEIIHKGYQIAIQKL